MYEVDKVQLAELQGLEIYVNISQVSQEKIRGLRADSSGKWAGMSEETIQNMVIKKKLKKRAKRKYDLFVQLQKRSPLGSTAGRLISVKEMQTISAHARKYGVRTEAMEMRETIAQLAFWDHEKAGFEKFEREMQS